MLGCFNIGEALPVIFLEPLQNPPSNLSKAELYRTYKTLTSVSVFGFLDRSVVITSNASLKKLIQFGRFKLILRFDSHLTQEAGPTTASLLSFSCASTCNFFCNHMRIDCPTYYRWPNSVFPSWSQVCPAPSSPICCLIPCSPDQPSPQWFAWCVRWFFWSNPYRIFDSQGG